MSGRRFPSTRPDGTAEVAARFAWSAHEAVDRAFADWRERRGDELRDEFSSDPFLERSGDEVLIVFPVRADSRRWKDYMVEAAREADAAGGSLLGFLDRVTGRPHHADSAG